MSAGAEAVRSKRRRGSSAVRVNKGTPSRAEDASGWCCTGWPVLPACDMEQISAVRSRSNRNSANRLGLGQETEDQWEQQRIRGVRTDHEALPAATLMKLRLCILSREMTAACASRLLLRQACAARSTPSSSNMRPMM